MRGEYQKILEEETANIPRLFVMEKIREKLSDAGVPEDETAIERICDIIFEGKNGKIEIDFGEKLDINLKFTGKDIEDIFNGIEEFLENGLENGIRDLASEISAGLRKQLRRDWLPQYRSEQASNFEFKARLEDRWGKGLTPLRMLLKISQEIGEDVYKKRVKSRAKRNLERTDTNIRLHARACQVSGEIITLLEAGYADGAMARWRTLHEIVTVATLIADSDNELAERYAAHEIVDINKSLNTYLATYQALGFQPPSKKEIAAVQNRFTEVISQYGVEFSTQYGWAANLVGSKRPNFAQLEEVAARSNLRSHYNLACHNIHAGVRALTQPLGVIPDSSAILIGPSNAGLEEPGQNTAISLAQINLTVFRPNWSFDEVVICNTLTSLVDDVQKELIRASKKLAKDEASLRRDQLL